MKKKKWIDLDPRDIKFERIPHGLTDTAKFVFRKGRHVPLIGQFAFVEDIKEETVEQAKKTLYEIYLKAKAYYAHHAGVKIGPIQWIVKDIGPYFPPSVGWKAYGDKPVSNEAKRRMDRNRKRAERAERKMHDRKVHPQTEADRRA